MQTVGVLAAVIGTTLLVGARLVRPRAETLVLAGGAALGFACVDMGFVLNGRIPEIYLADAALKLVFLGGCSGPGSAAASAPGRLLAMDPESEAG